MALDTNDQILDEFLDEAREIFDQLDLDFVHLEQNPDDKKLVANIFRAMHTLKGSSSFFAFRRLEKVAHAGESLLSRIRDGALILNLPTTDALLETADRLRQIVQGISDTREEVEGDDSLLLDKLSSLTEGKSVDPSKQGPLNRPSESEHVEILEQNLACAIQVELPSEIEAPIVSQVVEPQRSLAPTDTVVSAADTMLLENAKSTDVSAPVKVSVELLDNLMNLVSEMVLGRNRLLSFATHSGDMNFTSTVRTIDMITLELQERMMKTRMQPISHVWAKFPRLVRDLAQECGKKVELIQIGSETELDRTLLDGIRDPLVHIIRNSIDHGIESPASRLELCKRETGSITLRSMHENGMVVIEITDDGGGINIPLVAKKAVERGLVTEEKAAKLSDREIIDFIYLPGFSTKDVITNLSGRGVGMDVVRTNVQAIGGSVDIATGSHGTKIRLRIPLTLAIMPAVFVRCQDQRFAIPQNNLFEMVRHEHREDVPGLEDFYGVPVFRLRNKLIPLLFLNRELGLSTHVSSNDLPLNIVVVQSADMLFGLVVDEVLYMQEVVVKPVGPLLKSTSVYSGATILGDGRVALIFDIAGIAIRSGLLSKLIDKKFEVDIDTSPESSVPLQQMLLFDLVDLERIAIPLDYVDRLEMFPASRIERRGSQRVIVYGEHIMRLISLSDFVEGASEIWAYGEETVSVIVHYHDGQPIGFVVKQIHDIISAPSEVIINTPRQRGILGNAIVGEHAISFLNINDILAQIGIESSGEQYAGHPSASPTYSIPHSSTTL